MSVRVRIAPAPSGSLHIGNARTALYNWLFARRHGGAFILRIEDTDAARVAEEHVQSVLAELAWLGLDHDEGPGTGGPKGPYRQSERLGLYAQAARRLADEGRAYRCYCTPGELAERRKAALAEGRRPGYDGRCRTLSDDRRMAFEAEGRGWVLRFAVPEGETSFDDGVTGKVTVAHSEIDDFAIMRDSGVPLYVLAAAVDDALMEISHVIRGMDLQSATPRQLLLLDALGYPSPSYAHIPLVLGAKGEKLSKRYGGGTVAWYRDHGFLPDAVVNALALLGTGFGDATILTREEMIAGFSLEKVNASPAALNEEKVDWINGEHIRRMSDGALADALVPWLAAAGLVGDRPSGEERAKVAAVAPLVKTRIERLEQAPDLVRGIFSEPAPDPQAVDKAMREAWTAEFLQRCAEALEALGAWDPGAVEGALRGVQEAMELKPRKAFMPLYVAISGRTVSAPIFDSIAIIGREAAVARLRRAASGL